MLEKERIIQFLDLLIVPGSSIGAHGITFRDEFDDSSYLLSTARKICNEGLKVKVSGGCNVALTCSFMGDSDSYDRDNLLDYYYGNIAISDDGKYTTMVVAIPNVLVDSDGKEYFLGNFPKDLEKDNWDYADFPINKYFMDRKSIPKEFIVGYISGNVGVNSEEELEYSFMPNTNYIGLSSDEEKVEFFESIKSDLINCGVREITPEILDEVDNSILYPNLGLPKDLYLAQAQEYASYKYNGYIKK